MNEKMKCLTLQTKANDVDEKGIVTVAVNGIGIEDTQHDISMPGSFDNTLKNDMARMRWFLNHRQDQLLGVPISGKEQDGNLVMRGQINLKKEIGRDTYADYELYASHGRTLEHSIGVKAVRRDKSDRRQVLEWFMGEYSTLTNWGSNPQTFLVNLKGASRAQVIEAAGFVRSAFKQRGYTDERLKQYDDELGLLLKSLEGASIVACPHCGYRFDYDEVPEQTFSRQVLETASQVAEWIMRGVVEQEMAKLEPEIRASVLALLDSRKAGKEDLTTKGIEELMKYVRCPHCWSKVFRSDAVMAEEPQEKEDGRPAEEGAENIPVDANSREKGGSDDAASDDDCAPQESETLKEAPEEGERFWKAINDSFKPNIIS